MSAGAGRAGATDPDFSLVVLDDEGRPYLVLSSEPAPETGDVPVAAPVNGRVAGASVPAVAAGGPPPRSSERTP